MSKQWKLIRNGINVFTVQATVTKNNPFWILLRTDAHHDNPRCNQKLEKKHLEQAKDRDAFILDNGDLFCAMQGKYDKRSSKDAIRPEHQNGEYLDALIEEATDFYSPYIEHFGILGQGNHETKILKNHETNLTKRLVENLRKLGSPVQLSGYSGWIKFSISDSHARRGCKVLHHYHGSGGGGPVTRGVIQTNRMAVYTPDADIVFTGHTHDEWVVPIARQRLTHKNNLCLDEVLHVRAPGYKDAWGSGYAGWEVETAKPPKPIGALWLQLYLEEQQVKCEVLRAK